MSRRKYRRGNESRLGEIFVCAVVAFLIIVVCFKCVELEAKNQEYMVRQQELSAQIELQQKRAEDLQQLKKYVQTDSYVEETAEEKLGLVREGEIIFKAVR